MMTTMDAREQAEAENERRSRVMAQSQRFTPPTGVPDSGTEPVPENAQRPRHEDGGEGDAAEVHPDCDAAG